MCAKAYLKYLKSIDLPEAEKLVIINKLMEFSERLYDEDYEKRGRNLHKGVFTETSE
tara:strand:- start:2393 stop:2563 length:171 start_codon:yes stop_codon:yes gene_type:complete